jgi:hypothetical protein
MIPEIRVITNGHWRDFCLGVDVPPDVIESDFDYMDEPHMSDGFLCYRGIWYHIGDFVRLADGGDELGSWDGAYNGTFFDAVVIRISDCQQQYQIGHALW